MTALLTIIGGAVYAGCVADASYTQNGSTFDFVGDSSTSVYGYTCSWDFGDGSSSSLRNVSHTYASLGTYDVIFSIRDTVSDCRDTLLLKVFVTENLGCEAKATAHSQNGSTITFDGSASSSSSGDYSLNWNFGDGYFGSGSQATHTYSNPGVYNVTLSLIDSNTNCSDVARLTINIVGSPQPCKASFYVAADSNNTYGLYLVNNSTGTNKNTQYTWDFGDGTTSNAKYPTHQYTSFGLYNICLTISDSLNNCYSTYCDSVGMDSNGNILKLDGFGITIIDEAMLSVEETATFSGVQVYPNPSTGVFTFNIESRKGAILTIRTLNSIGQEVALQEMNLTTGSNTSQLDLSHLNDGLYFVSLQVGNEVKHVKLYLVK